MRTSIYYHKVLPSLLLLGLFPVASLPAQEKAPAASSQPQPSSRLDLSATGFHEPSRMDRTSEFQPSLSLDFVDANHVLLSFNKKGLFKRLPECTPDHEDRLMHAAILEIPSGNVVAETDWFLHDRRRYLWPLTSGKFLLRRWNKLYIVDSSLNEKLLLAAPKNLLWVAVTPDGSQVITETEYDKKTASTPKSSTKTKFQPKYVVEFLDVKTLAPQRTLFFNNLTHIDGTSSGYADVVRKGDIWLLRFGPSVGKRRNLARVRSQTVPVVLYPTENSLLIGRCATAGCNYGVTAFTLTGHRLWRQHWQSLRSFPEITRSDDGSRFTVSSLRVEPVAARPVLDDTQDDPFQTSVSERDVFRQEIQVFDTASGNSVLSISISPAVVTGQNVSISPDGRRLALLRGTALELFDLPSISADEQSKFASLKADVPGLFAMGSDTDYDTAVNAAPVISPEDEESMTADATSEEASKAESKADPKAPADASSQSSSEAANSPVQPPAPVADADQKSLQPDVAPLTTFKVSTKAVVVDVVVTDSKGHPVRGLSQQDFQLSEDNKPQSVRYFREFNDKEESPAPSTGESAQVTQSAAAGPTSATTPTTPAAPNPNVFNNRAQGKESGAATMVLFDTLNTPPQDQDYARVQLIKFLQSKPKVSQFALCMMSSGDYPLRLIQGFTTDENLLVAAMKSKKGDPRNNRWQLAGTETQNAVNTVSGLAGEGRTSGFQNLANALQGMQAEQFVDDTSERAARTIDSMMLLARYLSGISGRKNIVWLSSSFPIAISLGPFYTDPGVSNPNWTYKVKRATNLLADAQVAVYPVDVRGLQVFTAGLDAGAAVAGPRSFQPPDPTSPNATQVPSGIPQGTNFANMSAEQDTMTQFAVATGGKAFFNTNGIKEAISVANEQGSNYYSFSYTPSNKVYDGKFRKIKVQMAQKGYKLAYRQGYFADEVNSAAKEAQLARNAIATAMQSGSPTIREVPFSVRVYPVGGKKKVDRATVGVVKRPLKKKEVLPPQIEVQHYVVDYTMNGTDVRFVPTPKGGFLSSLGLMIMSYGTEGRMLAGMSTNARSDLSSEVYKKIIGGEIGFQEEVDIPVEATSMRLGVADELANHLGTVDVPLPVPVDPTAPKLAKNRLPEIEPD